MSSDDLDTLRHRLLLSPADSALALTLAQGLRRAGQDTEARAVCLACLSTLTALKNPNPSPSPTDGFLRQLLWSLPLPSDPKTRPWAVVGAYDVACGPTSINRAALHLIPDSAAQGTPCALWQTAQPKQGLLDLSTGNAIPASQPWMELRFGGRIPWPLVSDPHLPVWATLSETGGRLTLWAGPVAENQTRENQNRVELPTSYSQMCTTSQPGSWLLIDRPQTGLIQMFLDTEYANQGQVRYRLSPAWSSPVAGRMCAATLTPEGNVLAVDTEYGLTLYESFNTHRPPMLRIEDSLWMSFRTKLSLDGSRAFALNPWERTGEQAWWSLSIPDQTRQRFTTTLPRLSGWTTCPHLKTLALWTPDGHAHLYDIDSGSPIAQFHLCDEPLNAISFDPQTRFALCASWSAKKLWLLA